MESGVGLNDDVLVRILLKFINQHGFARLERLGNFRMDAERQIGIVVVGDGHLARFGQNFVAERWNGLDHAGAAARGARLAEHPLERLFGALARNADKAELVEGERFRRRFVLFKGLLQSAENLFAVAALFHVDEVHDDDAAEVAQADLPDDFLYGFEVGLNDRVLEARGTLAHELARVDVYSDERFGVINDDIAAGLEPNFGAESFVELVLDAELFEDRLLFRIELDAVRELWLEAANEFKDLSIFLFAVNPNGSEIVADVIAKNTFDEIQVAVQDSGRFALVVLFLDFIPGLAEELDVGANFFVRCAACGRSNDETAGERPARFANQTAEPRTVFRTGDFARNADVVNRRHINEEAARQCDMASDASAFLAEGFLRDLHDDFLAGLQHFRNELWTARRTTMSAETLAAVMTMAAAAIESAAATATPVGTPAAVSAATIPAAAERLLEAGTSTA